MDLNEDKVILVNSEDERMTHDNLINQQIDIYFKEIGNYTANSRKEINTNMIFIYEYDGLRETIYSSAKDVLLGNGLWECIDDLSANIFRDLFFVLDDKSALFGEDLEKKLYEPNYQIQM